MPAALTYLAVPRRLAHATEAHDDVWIIAVENDVADLEVPLFALAKACADRAWARTIAAARDIVASRPKDAVARAILASSLAKKGNLDEAQTEIRHALESNPTNANVLYQASVVAALRGSSDSAISWLERAIAAGFPSDDAARDPVLESLRQLPAFRNAVKSRT